MMLTTDSNLRGYFLKNVHASFYRCERSFPPFLSLFSLFSSMIFYNYKSVYTAYMGLAENVEEIDRILKQREH